MRPNIEDWPPLYVHVGFLKTGTTFLQREIFPSLKSVRYIYGAEAGNLLRRLANEEDASFDLSQYQKYFYPLIQSGPSLISHDILIGNTYYLHSNQPRAADRLAQLFPHANIIFTIRRQDTMLLSLYLMLIWTGDSIGLADFLKYKNGEFQRYYGMEGRHINLPVLNFDHMADLYAERFGGRVNFSVYEHMVDNLGDYVRRFCEMIGETTVPAFRNVTMMKSYGFYQYALSRVLNRFFRSPRNPLGLIPGLWFPGIKPIQFRRILDQNWMHRWFDLWPKNKIVMKKEISRAILEFYSPSNATFDQKWQLGLDRWGYILEE